MCPFCDFVSLPIVDRYGSSMVIFIPCLRSPSIFQEKVVFKMAFNKSMP